MYISLCLTITWEQLHKYDRKGKTYTYKLLAI